MSLGTLLQGDKVRLLGLDPYEGSKLWAKWAHNSEYIRLLDSGPAILRSPKVNQEWIEKHLNDWLEYEFFVQAIADGAIIGGVGLEGNIRTHQEAFVGIGIGEPEFWGKGYGTEAMKLILEYGFMELNLHRVSLNVFSYNTRAIRSYEKSGFVLEATSKNALIRDGKKWDMLWMGILKKEWEAKNGN